MRFKKCTYSLINIFYNLSVSAKLNLKALNKLTSQEYPQSVKVSSLPHGYIYLIKKVRQVQIKYGMKYVLDFKTNSCIFVPDETNTWMMLKPKQVKKMTELAERHQIGFKHTGYSGIEFVNLDKSQKENDNNSSDESSMMNSQKTDVSIETFSEMMEKECEEGEEEEEGVTNDDENEENCSSTLVHIK